MSQLEATAAVDSRRTIVVAWVWAAFVAVAGVAVSISVAKAGLLDVEGAAFVSLIFIYGGLGLLMAIRRPGNGVAWLFFAIATYGVLQGATIARFGNQTVAPDPVTLWDVAALVFDNTGYFVGLMIPLFLFFYTFPTGRFLNRRWSWAGWVAVFSSLAILFSFTFATELGPGAEQDWTVTNPIGFLDTSSAFNNGVLAWIFGIGILGIGLGAFPAIIVRYRRADTEVRTQIKWVVYGSLIGAAGFLVSVIFFGSLPNWLEGTLFILFVAGVPITVTIAITKYRLYDIDIVISRTVVLTLLAVFITATYALIVVGVGRWIGGESDSLLLPIGATALVAVAFEPVRLRAQRWANSLVYGRRATPYEVVSDLTEQLSRAEEGEGILVRMSNLLRDGTGADRASVWLGELGSMTVAANSPVGGPTPAQPQLDGEVGFEVRHNDQIVGALEVVKPRGTVLSSAERSLIADLAGSAGAVLGHQRLHDSLSTRADELEESRTRLLGVQDAERRRLEQDLHEGAEQYIVALKVKIGVASQLAGRAGDEKLELLLAELASEAQAALDDVQSLAKGIYPPVLESGGLSAAVSALASSTPVDVFVEGDGVGRYPIEVETAVYFDISEAVTNAVKHGKPPIQISLAEEDDTLRFSVIDDGPGFDIDQSDKGSGLENMADRLQSVGGTLEVNSSKGTRTEISGSVPV